MIMFTSKSNRIFAQVIDDYHRCDDVDAPVRNPYANGSIEYLLYLKNWIDTVQWHLEDIIRDPNIDPVEALKIKRRIDARIRSGPIWWSISTAISSICTRTFG